VSDETTASRRPHYGDTAWFFGRRYLGWPARWVSRLRVYGASRVPQAGGVVLAINHLHWLDVPIIGVASPRNINFVAKVEVHRVFGFGAYMRTFGALSVRRGESDRDAVRGMRQAARDGRCIGLFVEGTRQKSGRPGQAQPGAAMVALQEDVPVVPVAIYGTQNWKPTNLAPCSIAFGEPLRFDGMPKNGRGYKEATAVIEQRIHGLFDWLEDVHRRGRPKGLVPPP
jgi:1-acyl-sn-glycerol-3-phosphate acyltransferase